MKLQPYILQTINHLLQGTPFQADVLDLLTNQGKHQVTRKPSKLEKADVYEYLAMVIKHGVIDSVGLPGSMRKYRELDLDRLSRSISIGQVLAEVDQQELPENEAGKTKTTQWWRFS